MKAPKTILITGASSGLGKALAIAYAGRNRTLFLTGRDEARLQLVADKCAELGADVIINAMDITDKRAVETWVLAMDKQSPIDLVIANAGVSGGTSGGDETPEQIYAIMKTNVDGVLHSILPLIAPMKARGKGQIAVVSSLAGFRGMPSAPAYSASKNAVKAFGEGLRGQLDGTGVGVTVICPGFIQTPLTDVNQFKMPMIWKAEKAASVIKKRLKKNPPSICFPWPLALTTWFLSIFPRRVSDPIYFRMPKK